MGQEKRKSGIRKKNKGQADNSTRGKIQHQHQYEQHMPRVVMLVMAAGQGQQSISRRVFSDVSTFQSYNGNGTRVDTNDRHEPPPGGIYEIYKRFLGMDETYIATATVCDLRKGADEIHEKNASCLDMDEPNLIVAPTEIVDNIIDEYQISAVPEKTYVWRRGRC